CTPGAKALVSASVRRGARGAHVHDGGPLPDHADRPLLRLQDDGAVVRPNLQLDAADSERAALLGDATAFDRSPRQAEQRAKNAVSEEAHPAAPELSKPGEEGYGALTSSTVRPLKSSALRHEGRLDRAASCRGSTLPRDQTHP